MPTEFGPSSLSSFGLENIFSISLAFYTDKILYYNYYYNLVNIKLNKKLDNILNKF